MSTRADCEAPFPLAGLRVLDLSRALSGPYASRVLADLGADVVKVELEGADITQAFGAKTAGHTGLYVQTNAGKRSISVDLGTTGGAEVVVRLAAAADVVIENFRPGTVDRLGVGWRALSAANPRLVMLSVSGFGQWGPETGRQAYAPVIHAESGVIGRQAEVDGANPSDLVMAMADSVTALHGAIAVLAALSLRDRTGAGQHIDLSMLESMLATDDYVHYSLEDQPLWAARGRIYNAAGGPVLLSGDLKHLWARLRGAGLVDPDPTATGEAKFAGRERAIETWVGSFADRAELIRSLEAAGVAWAEVRTPATVLDSPSVRAREVVAEVDDRRGGTRPIIRMPYRFSDASSAPRGGAPYVGEHNADVLAEWADLDADAVAALVASGALIAPQEEAS